ncbi:MAG: NAD-binding protein [Culicoidibacterales bacterium]
MKVIIIGGGKIGSYVGQILSESGCEIKIIEHREAVIHQLYKVFPKSSIIEGEGSDMSILEEAGIRSTDVVAAVTGSDEVNLVVSTIAKYEFGIKKVIGRVSNPKNDWLYTLEMGVDVKISQASMIANIIVDQIKE